jgi:hypothetical protein
MPLQIRRGTEAERTAMTQPLAQGELLYVTNEQRLYIGNGSTLGGVQITGYNDENAQDAAALLFSNGAHTGITFTYNDAAASISAVVDLANYQGTIGATSFKGSIFADDSTLLVDAVSGTIVGPVTGNITGNVTGNLTGNVTGNVVGNVTGNLTGNSAGIHTGAMAGNVTGNVTGDVTGNLAGNVIGDVKGSVFAEDSTVMVDATSGNITAGVLTVSTRLDVNNILGDSFLGLVVSADGTLPLTVSGIGTLGVSSGQVYFNINAAKGSLATPTTTAAGDVLGGISIQGLTATGYKAASLIAAGWEAGAVLSDTFPKSNLSLVAYGGGSTLRVATLDSQGVFTAPVLKPGVYADATARDAAITAPAAGMMIFLTAGTKFQGYTGAAWVDLN